jgi:metal-responsive CopG/Arc/MetJ family transcriptional regulator
MKAMKKFLLRLPESMSNEIDQIAEELYCTKSQFIRQSITRNLDICRNVEMPLLRRHYQETSAKLLRPFSS